MAEKKIHKLVMRDMFANEKELMYVGTKEEVSQRWQEQYGGEKSSWRLEEITPFERIEDYRIKLEKIAS
ncbi:MAG: hypothetical protein ACP5D2_00340 [Candidatus Nanoarchaeia archaeon]